MKAVVITSLSGPSSLKIQEMPEPTPKPGQTIVRVRAGYGFNFADFMTSKGGYPGAPPPPLIAGREFAGVEESTGRRVMGYAQWAAFAEKTSAYPSMLWTVPDHWSRRTSSAAFPVNYFTAYLAFWQAGMPSEKNAPGAPLLPVLAEVGIFDSDEKPHPRVLIHAVAGGVGTRKFAIAKIGKLLGVEMYGTSSSDEKLSRV